MKGFDITSFIFIMVLLYLGGFIGGYLQNWIPFFATGGWIGGILLSMVQMVLITVVGLATGKLSFSTIIIGGIVIFVGGIVGSYLSGFVNLSGLYATVLTLAVQTVILMFMGLVRGGGKTPIPMKAK